MKRLTHIVLALLLFVATGVQAQTSSSPAPYCSGVYTSGNCNQGGPSNTPGNYVNDFIDNFITSGASGNNISNIGSGCDNGPGNYIHYCQYYLQVAPGDVITCTLQSGIIYQQGFAIFIDWNQDNVFNLPSELVAATTAVPPAATPTVLTFTVPATQQPGAYRLRVRCSYNTPGTSITPCGTFNYGETEDYTLYVGAIPANSSVVTATATGNATLCTGQTINLGVNTGNASITYTWTGPNSFSSTVQNPTITNATSAASGIYTVVTSGGCPATKTVTVVVAPDPGFVLTPSNVVICQGNHFTGSVSFTSVVNPSAFSYNWSCNAPSGIFQTPAPGPGVYSPGSQTTVIGPSFINSPQEVLIYTVVVTPTVQSCPVVRTLTLTINNPVTPILTLPPPMCNTGAPVSLTATPGGGTWIATNTLQASALQPGGLFSPGSVPLTPNFGGATVNVLYSASVGTCIVQNTGTLFISQFVSPALISTLTTLCSSSLEPAVDLMGLVQHTLNGSWSGLNVNNNYFSSSQPPLPTGTYSLTYTTGSSPNPTVCPASTILAVPVFSPTAPAITPISNRCNNSGTIQLTASPTLNLLWTGNVGVSSTGILTPSACAISSVQNGGGIAPNNTIFCTGGLGTCTATGSLTFEIDLFRPAALSASVPPLCVNSNPVNLLSVVQNTLGYWQGESVLFGSNQATGTYTSNNIFNPIGLSGTYTLAYTNPSYPSNICESTQILTVSVLNPPIPNITISGPYCNISGPVQLTVTPNTGTWTASSYLTSGGLLTPSLCPVGSNLVQYIIGTSTCNTQQTASISVEGFVPATISGNLPDQCITGMPLNLQPFTLNNIGSWHGQGILGSTFSPSLAGTGQVVISYNTASSPSGLCPDQATVAVNVYSLATPAFNSAGPFCTSALPLQLQVSPVGGIFGGANTNAVNAQGLFNPSAANIGNNIINYSITSGPCVAYAQTTIAIERFVSANFIATAGPFCKNDPHLARNLNELVQNPGGTWRGKGVDQNSGVFTFTNANVGDNNIITYKTHSMPTATLCPDSTTIQITVYDTPPISVQSDVSQGCAPLRVTLSPNTNFGEGSWIFSDSSATQQGLNIYHTFTSPGSYSVAFNYSVMVAADFMCVARTTIPGNIKVFESPKADFIYSPEEITISDPDVHFTNTSANAEHNRYTWTIAGSSVKNLLYDIDPDFVFPLPGDYNVTLSAANLYGCKNDITKIVSVKSTFNVYIPSSFTPNNDGLNDSFFPVFSEYGLDDLTYSLEIFDRWGALLFSTTDKTQGWDGKASGHAAKQDVYVYKLEFKDLNGNLYHKNGQISLLR